MDRQCSHVPSSRAPALSPLGPHFKSRGWGLYSWPLHDCQSWLGTGERKGTGVTADLLCARRGW